MSSIDRILADLREKGSNGYWGERILAQLEYASKVSKVEKGAFDDLIQRAAEFVSLKQQREGAVTSQTVREAEDQLAAMSHKAKSYKMICTAHAHIDMNWMWRWDETVAITLDTFRTMLDLMKEYPDFRFSQSQASVYRIVEEYAPDMLEEIKERVKEGRWEVTASTWVEADKNMPNGESQARHILYTKRYLAGLLELDPDEMNLDFEPDTFGHSLQVPEILTRGGVKYYYHCRGYEGHNLYRWKSPSGSSIIVYREPIWYNAEIKPSMALYVPEFCQQYGMDTMLKVYGVGDHGGGPTRRDLERILDMNTWPVFPQIRFGTFSEYYRMVDEIGDQLPVVEGELNPVFSGCYTTQTRIKMANRAGEAILNEAEAFSSAAALCTDFRYSGEAFEESWENILFNQFHDIIPGSGIVDTREYAMGLFQKTMAAANNQRSLALKSIIGQIDTSRYADPEEDITQTVSEGAGVGFGIKDFQIIRGERGKGKTRIYHVFNPSLKAREECAEFVVWDWNGSLERMVWKDEQGNALQHQLLDHGFNEYWGHRYMRVLLRVKAPSLGYATYTLGERDDWRASNRFPAEPRVERVNEYVLENDCIRAVFDSVGAAIISLVDKESKREYVDKERPAGIFRWIEEDTDKGMTAWIVGRYKRITNLTEGVKIRDCSIDPAALRQWISYEISFSSSVLRVTVSLDAGSSQLKYTVECDWQEAGKPSKGIPQLGFYVPVNYECKSFKYDVPFGTIVREGVDMDVPANSWAYAAPQNQEQKSMQIVTDSKYGFRSCGSSMSVTLIRSSYDPDPYPELGMHRFKLAINLTDSASSQKLVESADQFNHPLIAIPNTCHLGGLPLSHSFLQMEKGDVAVSAVKLSEGPGRDQKMIVRVYETEGSLAAARIRLPRKVKKAEYVDINEKTALQTNPVKVEETTVTFTAPAYSVTTLCIEFE